MKYLIGLECGGMMEYEGAWMLHQVLEIEAESVEEAKDKWAEITGTNKSPTWNSETRMDWGFAVVEKDAFFRDHPTTGYEVKNDMGYQGGI